MSSCVCDHRMDGVLVESVDCPDHGDSLAAIRARVAAAIPGPWVPDYDTCDCGDGYGCVHPPWVHAVLTPVLTPVVISEPGPGVEARDYHRSASELSDFPADTGRFIAHARVDVETLLARIDALEAWAAGPGRKCPSQDAEGYTFGWEDGYAAAQEEVAEKLGDDDA